MAVDKTIGCIYYTDFHVHHSIHNACLENLKKVWNGPMVSVSLGRPLDLGKNIVIENEERSYPTMVLQILTALQNLDTKYVFFLEHDVLYHPSHFNFIPPDDTLYYYNVNNWRWHFPLDRAISYDGLTSLSSLCCNRETAVNHYLYRTRLIQRWGLDKIRSREPRWARKFGYEPGTKKRRNGGVTNEEHIKRWSEFPNVDIRHGGTFSQPKVTLESFKHTPENWREGKASEIPGWDLKKMFNLWN